MGACKNCKHHNLDRTEQPCFSCISEYNFGSGQQTGFEPRNPYWERICAMADRQRAKGISTYGQGLESNPADMLKRIEYLQEEMIDGLMYCEWIKDELKKMEGSKNDSI